MGFPESRATEVPEKLQSGKSLTNKKPSGTGPGNKSSGAVEEVREDLPTTPPAGPQNPDSQRREIVRFFDPKKTGLGDLLQTFWQAHDPTQGYRQGNDRGTQYRSAIFASDQAQLDQILQSAQNFQKALTAAGYGKITTEMALADEFYYAETYHQQYLHKVPHGYCGLHGTGVACLG